MTIKELWTNILNEKQLTFSWEGDILTIENVVVTKGEWYPIADALKINYTDFVVRFNGNNVQIYTY